MTIAENVKSVKARIAAAAISSGRKPEDILLVAATKMNDAERVRQAVAAGVDACGENRVQELQEKKPLGAYEGAPLHFIGHLQKNKVKYLVGQVDLIESVDSLELLEAIDKRAAGLGAVQDVLLEVNIGGGGGQIRLPAGGCVRRGGKSREFCQYPGARTHGNTAGMRFSG